MAGSPAYPDIFVRCQGVTLRVDTRTFSSPFLDFQNLLMQISVTLSTADVEQPRSTFTRKHSQQVAKHIWFHAMSAQVRDTELEVLFSVVRKCILYTIHQPTLTVQCETCNKTLSTINGLDPIMSHAQQEHAGSESMLMCRKHELLILRKETAVKHAACGQPWEASPYQPQFVSRFYSS